MSYMSSSPSRASSASKENKTLRETVVRLQQELVHSRAETQKVTDQLNCLIMLVKRAWQGDRSAAVHVGNIVGAAPPDIEEEITSDMKIVLSAKPKKVVTSQQSRATNNWALLTVGLLNKEYTRVQKEVQEKQLVHLQHRHDFLQEQLLHLRDELSRQPHLSLRRNSSPEHSRAASVWEHRMQAQQNADAPRKERVNSATSRKKLAQRHLYRQPSQGSQSGMTLGDLVVEPNMHSHSNKVWDGLRQMTAQQQQHQQPDPDRMQVDYDDHQRYTQVGLYHLDQVVGADAVQRRRPVSASSLKQADARRARPKSAAVPKGRPLKNETTYPIPKAKARAKSASLNRATNLPHGSIKRTNQQFFMTNKEEEEEEEEHSHSDGVEGKEEEEEVAPQEMSVSVKQPESVSQLVRDLERMNGMEEDFKKSALLLQKKLGIPGDAFVY